MKKNRATCGFLSVIGIVALLVIALGVAAALMVSKGSLGEKMNLIVNQGAKETPTAAAPVALVVTATPAPLDAGGGQELVPEPTETPTSAPAEAVNVGSCGNRGSLLLLFVGADFAGGVPPLGADAVRVVKVDYENKKVTVVAFPRDLYVQTAGLANQNINATRLGLAYHYMKTATIGTEKHQVTTATTLVGQALYDNFGVAPQNYLTVEMSNMAEMVDAMGGVDIIVPEAFTSERKMYFAAGSQRLDGARAMEFVRTFQPGGDPARRQRQNLFVKAMEKTVLNAGIVTKIPQLYQTFDESIVTDLSPKMIADLACMTEVVPEDQVAFYEVSGDLVVQQSDGALYPKVEAVKAKLVEWLGE
jgi:LCP family protein required for cell wall assembly